MQVVLPSLFCWIVVFITNDVVMAANAITTDAKRYVLGTPINLSWNYISNYIGPPGDNQDLLAIISNDTSLAVVGNIFSVIEMYVFVSTLNKLTSNTTIRNIGTVTFDGNAPDESRLQTWPLTVGNYKAYLIDTKNSIFTIYGASDTFSVAPPVLSTDKPSYYFNESITLSWAYTSSNTGTGINADYIGIFDPTGEVGPFLFLWVSVLRNGNVEPNSTIRNTGTVILDSQPPDESYFQSWPLSVGSYRALLVNNMPVPQKHPQRYRPEHQQRFQQKRQRW